MADSLPVYEVFAIKYAEMKARPATDMFIGADPHDAPVDLAYYVWLVRNETTTICCRHWVQRRSRPETRAAISALSRRRLAGFGGRAERSRRGDRDASALRPYRDAALFPNATFHLQDKEIAFATGRYMRHRFFPGYVRGGRRSGFVRDIYANRVESMTVMTRLRPV